MTGKLYKCCICGITDHGYGNNPDPIKKKGRCCDECNADQVIPVRLGLDNIKKKLNMLTISQYIKSIKDE